MTTATDKRRFPRTPCVESLSLSVVESQSRGTSAPERLYLSSHDISLAGISVELPVPIKPDTDVELWIVLLHGGTYHLYGTIAWCAAPEGSLMAGIALEPDRADGRLWSALFDPEGYLQVSLT